MSLMSCAEAVAGLKKLFSLIWLYTDWICFVASVVRVPVYYTGLAFEVVVDAFHYFKLSRSIFLFNNRHDR